MLSCVNVEDVHVSVMISFDAFRLIAAVAMLAALTVADRGRRCGNGTVMSYATHVLATTS
jgi:hypothetical protein